MNANISLFVICVEAIIYLLSYSLHNFIFEKMTFIVSVIVVQAKKNGFLTKNAYLIRWFISITQKVFLYRKNSLMAINSPICINESKDLNSI